MAATDTLGLIGQTIDDKYVVESCVGEGGFGVVYRAMHKLWQKPVAIKCFKTLMDASPAMREQLLRDFIQEGALLSELSARTASIVQARDVGTLTTRLVSGVGTAEPAVFVHTGHQIVLRRLPLREGASARTAGETAPTFRR